MNENTRKNEPTADLLRRSLQTTTTRPVRRHALQRRSDSLFEAVANEKGGWPQGHVTISTSYEISPSAPLATVTR